MSYHCSLSAIRAPSRSKAKKRFFPQVDYLEAKGWKNLSEVWAEIGGSILGAKSEWRLPAHFYIGQFRGLPSTRGTLAAISVTKALVIIGGSGKNFVIGHKDNFERIETPHDTSFDVDDDKSAKVASRKAQELNAGRVSVSQAAKRTKKTMAILAEYV